jgi:hypothetical protein
MAGQIKKHWIYCVEIEVVIRLIYETETYSTTEEETQLREGWPKFLGGAFDSQEDDSQEQEACNSVKSKVRKYLDCCPARGW